MRDLAGRGQADGRHTSPGPVAWAPTRHGERELTPWLGTDHPAVEQLEAVAYGWLGGPAAQPLLAHAAACPLCGPRLGLEAELHRQLLLLRYGEPRVEVVARVLDQVPPRPAELLQARHDHRRRSAAVAARRRS